MKSEAEWDEWAENADEWGECPSYGKFAELVRQEMRDELETALMKERLKDLTVSDYAAGLRAGYDSAAYLVRYFGKDKPK